MNLEIKNLSFSYKGSDDKSVDNISFEMQDSQIVILLGLNGCGKTTLIKNIAGLLKPSAGEILFNEKNIFNMRPKERSEYISYVPQRNACLLDIQVRDYLSFGFMNRFKFYEKPNNEHMQKIEDWAEKLGIDDLLDKTLDKLSGGQGQMVSICGALLQETPLILLDEPTSALDLKNENIILNLLSKIVREKKEKSIIMSSHNPNHALYLDSEVVLLEKGKLIKYGNSKDIINPECLKKIYGDNICWVEKSIGFKSF